MTKRIATPEELGVLREAGRILAEMGYTTVRLQVGFDDQLELWASGHPTTLAFMAQDAMGGPL